MKVHIVSDIHFEFGDRCINIPEEADLLIVAGDLDSRGHTAVFDLPTITVAGNHEFYGGDYNAILDALKKSDNTFLENDCFVFNGVRFIGCTLWTDFALYGDPVKAKLICGRMMNDYNYIAINGRRLTPDDTEGFHHQSVNYLDTVLSVPFDGKTVVITHHLPSERCVNPRYSSSGINAAYASNLEWMIEKYQPDFWFYGHSHENVDPFYIGKTLLLSNPVGYPHDPNHGYAPDLIVEI